MSDAAPMRYNNESNIISPCGSYYAKRGRNTTNSREKEKSIHAQHKREIQRHKFNETHLTCITLFRDSTSV